MMHAEPKEVFISYSRRDKESVEDIVNKLDEKACKIWFDQWEIMGGSDWQEIMQAAIYACGCCAVFLGAQKPDNWQDAEMKLALNRKNNDKEKKFTVIPVLLDTANYDTVKDYLSTSFLGLGSWISFKHHDLEWPLFQLCCGIKREKPDLEDTGHASGPVLPKSR
jgi:TIR domain